MPSSPNPSIHSTTNSDAIVPTKHASSFLPPDSSLPTISDNISSYRPKHRNSSNSDMRTRNDTPTITALQIAEERHAREIQALKGKHGQDLETLREEMQRVHDVEMIEWRMPLNAEHKRHLLELKEGRERGLKHRKAFFVAMREKSAACSPRRSPAGATADLSRERSLLLGPGPGPASASTSSTASSSATATSLPTSPGIPISSNIAITPASPHMPPRSSPAAAPHVHFLD
ncbi:MAG: hypothetical protein Q9175_007799 [Cornicularia normoerica]